MPETRQLAAIMFTDIVGYTALMGENEASAYQLLKKNRHIQKPIIEKRNGKWLKEMGDGVLASFQTVSDAVYCAIEIQETCMKETDLKLRIGIHLGEVIVEEGDVFGDGVNIASRLEPLAPAGGIYISESVFRNIQNKEGIHTDFVREEKLKNVKYPIKIYKVKVQSVESLMTEPVKSEPDKNIQKHSSRKNIIIASIAIMIILILVVMYFTVTRKDKAFAQPESSTVVEKTIAVLPFVNDSPDKDNEYFCNGMMEEILNQLQKINDLRVKSRTAAEQYRNPQKDIKTIGNELGVAYILAGSVRKAGNDIRITTQLIDVNSGDHLWSEIYDGNYTEKIFDFQSNVARKVASSLNAIILPEEEKRISFVPVKKIDAYDLILQAREYRREFWDSEGTDTLALEKAEILYYKALKIDPSYSKAWIGLGGLYVDRHNLVDYFNENYLDSAFLYCDQALSINPNEASAFSLKAHVYFIKGDIEEAKENYEKSLEYSTSDKRRIETSWRLSRIYIQEKEYLKGINLTKEAISLAKGDPWAYSNVLYRIGGAYKYLGQYEEARDYWKQHSNLGSRCYLPCYAEFIMGNFQTALDCGSSCCVEEDNSNYCNYLLAIAHFQLNKFEESLKYFKYLPEETDMWWNVHGIEYHYREGFALIQLGQRNEGMELIKKQLLFLDMKSKLNRSDDCDYHYAAIYAYLGNPEKAIHHLKRYQEMILVAHGDLFVFPLSFARHDIMFKSIWENEEFKEIINEELLEQEKIKQLLSQMEDR